MEKNAFEAMQLPQAVLELMAALEKAGHTAWLVGGCVRDRLLSLVPQDWDLSTSARPEELAQCLAPEAKVVPTGLRHGTVTVLWQQCRVEVSTFRSVLQAGAATIETDLACRDFTINGMAYHPGRGLLDPHGGQQDLKKKQIRGIGLPGDRFREDPLRMLRAIRFAAGLDFEIEKETWQAVIGHHQLIVQVSPERIRDEWCKILVSPRPGWGMEAFQASGLMAVWLPELEACVGFEQHTPYHHLDVFAHSLLVLAHTPPELVLRLAALLHDVGKPLTFFLDERKQGHFYGHEERGAELAEEMLTRLRFDGRTIEQVCRLIRFHMQLPEEAGPKALRKFIQRVGAAHLSSLFQLQLADMKSTAAPSQAWINQIRKRQEACLRLLKEKPPLAVKDLEINGDELKQMGIPAGPEMGKLLRELLAAVVESPELNRPDCLRALVKQHRDMIK